MQVVYIHGATASDRSFAFIQQSIQALNPIYLNYNKEDSAANNLDRMIDRLTIVDKPVYYITHSLGGIYAVHLQSCISKSAGAISLATPFNGSEIAAWSTLFVPNYRLFRDITPKSTFISQSLGVNIRIPWMQVVTTVGDVPWLVGANDGVVTRDSMTCRRDVTYATVDRNHYEIVQSQRVVDYIKTHMTHTKEKYHEQKPI